MATVETLNPQLSYFCHQCNRTVTLSPNPNLDLSCPLCNGGFLEEVDSNNNSNNPNPNPNPNPNLLSSLLFPDPFSILRESIFNQPGASVTRRSQFVITPSSMFSSSSGGDGGFGGGGGYDPSSFIQSYFANQQANGLNIQFVVESSDGLSRVPANLGDYVIGSGGIEQLMQHIMENDPNRYGTPPASETAVEGLPSVVVGEEVVNSESNSCAVCMSEFEMNGEVKQMPCKHLFHPDCIIPWLKLHNSCPVCRFELPTDDQDYETRKTGGGGGGGGGEGSGSGGSGSPAGRTFNIPLNWPFGGGASGPWTS